MPASIQHDVGSRAPDEQFVQMLILYLTSIGIYSFLGKPESELYMRYDVLQYNVCGNSDVRCNFPHGRVSGTLVKTNRVILDLCAFLVFWAFCKKLSVC